MIGVLSMTDYRLEDQVGFVLRRVNQRHLAIFSHMIPELTPTQFAAMARLVEVGQASQNELGRLTAMDAATVKGVVDRLRKRGFILAGPNPTDSRRISLSVSEEGKALFNRLQSVALRISEKTLTPLSQEERVQFLEYLKKLM
ncbi:MAG: MarR family transcriptional regulator [Rhodobacteraceae bacterium]|nr:MarR family transcriptional regulator [Paracoccaceae bacterium]